MALIIVLAIIYFVAGAIEDSAKKRKPAATIRATGKAQAERERQKQIAAYQKAQAARERAEAAAERQAARDAEKAVKDAERLKKAEYNQKRNYEAFMQFNSDLDMLLLSRDQLEAQTESLYRSAETSSNDKLKRQLSAAENKLISLDTKIYNARQRRYKAKFEYHKATREIERLCGSN